MSKLVHKVKDKAKEGFRAVNTERKKHFGSQATKPRGGSRAPVQSTSFKQIKQNNDLFDFEAILDDDSEPFALEQNLKPKASSSSEHLDSVGTSSQSQSFDHDLFNNDFEPPPREIGSDGSPPSDPLPAVVNKKETENDLFSDNFEPPPREIGFDGSPPSDPLPAVVSKEKTNDLFSDDFKPPPREIGSDGSPPSDPLPAVVNKKETENDLFSDNFEPPPREIGSDGSPPSDPLPAVVSKEKTNDLFSDDFKPPPREIGSDGSPPSDPLPAVVSKEETENDLFSDDFEPPPREIGFDGSPPSDPLPAVVSKEETENNDDIPLSDVTQQASPHLVKDDRSSLEREVKQSQDLTLKEPYATEGVETTEGPNALDQANAILETVDQKSVPSDPVEHSHEQGESEPSKPEDEPSSDPIDPGDLQEVTSQKNLTDNSLPAPEHTLDPPTSTTLTSNTSLSSSFEDDHFCSLNVGSPEKSRDSRGVSSERSDDELTNTAALLEELLAPKSKADSHPLQVPSAVHESVHLDSGIFDNGSHKKSPSEDFLEVNESHYSVKETKGTSFTSPSVSPHKPAAKRNSAGKLPPARPPISPSVRRKFGEKSVKKDRIPASDLFDDDFVSVPYPNQSKPTVPTRPSAIAKPLHRSSPSLDKISQSPDRVSVSPSPVTQPVQQDAAVSDDSRAGVTEQTPFKRQDSHMLDEPDLTLPYHLLLALTLYIYYSLNPWSYLAGFLAGFLMVYLLVGTVFVWYVVTQEHERKEKKRERPGLSQDFLQQMKIDLNDVRNYKSYKFLATLKYDHTSRQPRQRMRAEIRLEDDFFLILKIFHDGPTAHPFPTKLDLRDCTVTHAPDDLATERKRRWSKKFPICITKKSSKFKIFLFSPTSREKENWFRRLRHAADGHNSDSLVKHLTDYVEYMEKYFPNSSNELKVQRSQSASRTNRKAATSGDRIQYSRESEDKLKDEESVSITHQTSPLVSHHSRLHSPSPQTMTSIDRQGSSASTIKASGSIPKSVPSDILWLNAIAARMAWDVWHDTRWKDWVTSRIQKKLAKVKTPLFMDKLTVIDVDVGKDMPVVNKLCGGPKLDMKGMWVWLDVTYEGCFVITIKTRLKLGKKETKNQGQQMSVLKKKESSLPATTLYTKHSSSGSGLSHVNAARSLGSSMALDDELDSGSSDEETSSLGASIEEELHKLEEHLEDPSPAHQTKKGKLKSAVKRIGKRVANSSLVQRAFEKVSSYPLFLTVVVKRLDGVLAVNIPPPLTDTIWFGFQESPHLELTAKPKLGQREVKLSAVTQWIEKKLCDVVNKKLVLPEMEDIVIKVLNSGLNEDTQKVLVNDSDQT